MTIGIPAKHEAQARERFDRWSKSRTFQRLQPWLVYIQRKSLNMIDWSQVSHFLDVGCGNGWAVYEATQLLVRDTGGLACGCDLSIQMLKQRLNWPSRPASAYFFCASAQFLPFVEQSFDAILCTVVFHHVSSPERVLGEFERVLRPGGQVIIADRCRDQSVVTWIWDRLHRWFEKGHIKYYRKDELLALLRATGFEYHRVAELEPSYAQTNKLSSKVTLFKATKSH